MCLRERAAFTDRGIPQKQDAGDWKLVIVGDGPRRKNLEGIVSKLNIGDRVIFTGFQEDVDFFLSQSKIFVLPSLIEGFPNALIEAMANSLAPVSFNCEAGPSEIIEHGREWIPGGSGQC